MNIDDTVITGVSALGGAFLGATLSYLLAQLNDRRKHRKRALHKALTVINHVWANLEIDGNAPSNPHPWDMTMAYDAVDMMIVYCKWPNRTVHLFNDAVCAYNPNTQMRPLTPIQSIQIFREQVRLELAVFPRFRKDEDVDKDRLWINKLVGAAFPTLSMGSAT